MCTASYLVRRPGPFLLDGAMRYSRDRSCPRSRVRCSQLDFPITPLRSGRNRLAKPTYWDDRQSLRSISRTFSADMNAESAVVPSWNCGVKGGGAARKVRSECGLCGGDPRLAGGYVAL